MNIFLIPSWYPSRLEPLTGIFIKEQALFYGEINPDDRIIISSHRHGDYVLKVFSPLKSVLNLFRFAFDNCATTEQLSENVHEFYSPAIELPLLLTSAHASVLYKAHRNNLDKALAKLGSIDVIHAHVAFPAGWIAYRLSCEYQIPFVITEHMSPFPFQNPAFLKRGALTKWLREPLLHANERIAVSPSLARRMELFSVPAPVVVPNVVDERSFFPEENRSQNKGFVFFTLCELTKQKGIPDLLKAIQEVVQVCPSVTFIIGGKGKNEKEFRMLARRLKLDCHVQWLGIVQRNDAPRLFQQCDAFVMPSLHETFGVVFAEALGCGKPAIATRCGGPESIINKDNGLLVDIGDTHALAEAMLKIIYTSDSFDPDIIRRDFIQRFSRQTVCNELRSIYLRVSTHSIAQNS